MEISEILSAAADLLEKPGAWTQFDMSDPELDGETGRTITGKPVAGIDPEAVCWCVFGAVERVEGRCNSETTRAMEWLFGKWNNEIIKWNDAPGRTQAEVVSALRNAATQQGGEG